MSAIRSLGLGAAAFALTALILAVFSSPVFA